MAEATGTGKNLHLTSQFKESIIEHAPETPYLGYMCWTLWNSFYLSGTFWFQATDMTWRVIQICTLHFLVSSATLLLFILYVRNKSFSILSSKKFLIIAAALASLGTILVAGTRAQTNLNHVLFLVSALPSGVGTSMLFLRSVPLFVSVPPRTSLYRYAKYELYGACVYLMLLGLDNNVGVLIMILLPIFSAFFYSFSPSGIKSEENLSPKPIKQSRYFVLLFAVAVTAVACELMRTFIMNSLTVSESLQTTLFESYLNILLFILVIVVTFFITDSRSQLSAFYRSVSLILTFTLVILLAFNLQTSFTAALSAALFGLFMVLVRSIASYMSYQSKSNGILFVASMNSVLALGAAFGSVVTLTSSNNELSGDITRLIIIVAGCVSALLVFFFLTEKHMNDILLPIDNEEAATEDKKPKRWVVACEEFAQNNGLTERETKVFVALACGKSAQEIADENVVSIYTVRAHTRSIYAKLNVHSKSEMIARIKE